MLVPLIFLLRARLASKDPKGVVVNSLHAGFLNMDQKPGILQKLRQEKQAIGKSIAIAIVGCLGWLVIHAGAGEVFQEMFLPWIAEVWQGMISPENLRNIAG